MNLFATYGLEKVIYRHKVEGSIEFFLWLRLCARIFSEHIFSG